MMMMIMMIIIIIIITIIFINCNWVVTRWQWLFYTYTKYEIGYRLEFPAGTKDLHIPKNFQTRFGVRVACYCKCIGDSCLEIKRLEHKALQLSNWLSRLGVRGAVTPCPLTISWRTQRQIGFVHVHVWEKKNFGQWMQKTSAKWQRERKREVLGS